MDNETKKAARKVHATAPLAPDDPMTIWAEEEAEKRRKQAERDDNDPVLQERLRAKKQAEFERGVRLGWWDAEGNPIEDEAGEEE